MGVAEPSEQKMIDGLVARLATKHPSVRVAEVVHTIYSRFDQRPLREFVPLFVERGAKRELSQLSASDA
jgi:hypothetical protein